MAPGEVETREDEEQKNKFAETIELLLAAGYFRARIKGLSPFDKVVGGMVWSITTCDFDVDVDLLFQENSTIGQKIALTEKIVAVLPQMKCPHQIEPHQIQGLDFIHIFPVVQWLVKRAIETREELGDKIREYSLSQFHRSHQMPKDIELLERLESSSRAVEAAKVPFKPKRRFRKPESLHVADKETRVSSTLLEYGRKYGFSKADRSGKDGGSQKLHVSEALQSQFSAADTEEDINNQERKLASLMEGMSEAEAKEYLSSHAVGSIVGLQSDEIYQMASEYKQRQAALEQETSDMKAGMPSGVHAHQRQVAGLKKNIETEERKLEEVLLAHKAVEEKLTDAKGKLQEKQDRLDRINEELEKLAESETDENRSVLEQLRGLVALNETLKKQEQEFKAQCKVELTTLQERLEELRVVERDELSEDGKRLKLLEEQLISDKEKLQKIRLLLAKKNRDIASFQCKIDDIPTRAELAQYQRRFIELYNQVAATHKETKQFYTLYNTLDDSKLYLEKEVNLLNSIHDNFEHAADQHLLSSTGSLTEAKEYLQDKASTLSAGGKDEFLQQMDNIVKGVLQNRDKVERKKTVEKSKRDGLNDQLVSLTEKQRQYAKTVKEFKEECRKNEIILAKMRAAGRDG